MLPFFLFCLNNCFLFWLVFGLFKSVLLDHILFLTASRPCSSSSIIIGQQIAMTNMILLIFPKPTLKEELLLQTASSKDKSGRLRLVDSIPVTRFKEQIMWLRQRLENETTKTVNGMFWFAHITALKIGSQLQLASASFNVLLGRGSGEAFNESQEVSNVFFSAAKVYIR